MFLVTTECTLTIPHLWAVEVEEADYDNYIVGTVLVEQAFPYLSAEEREFFLTGYCPSCWDKTFSEEM